MSSANTWYLVNEATGQRINQQTFESKEQAERSIPVLFESQGQEAPKVKAVMLLTE